MADNKEKKHTWLYGVIVLLLLLLLVQTGFVLFYLTKSSQPSENDLLVEHESNSPASFFSRLRSGQPASIPQPDQEEDQHAEDPFMELGRLHAQMNRMFNMAMAYGPPIAQTLSNGKFSDFMPAVDLQETAASYIVKSDLPGLQKDKINVTVNGTLLTIQGVRENQSEKKDSAGNFYAKERSYGSFSRSLNLPGPVDDTRIQAEYENGVLTVILPKASDAKASQKVQIQ